MSTQERMSSARKETPNEVRMARLRAVLERWASRVDDWINPIVLKELRQAVRGRFLSLMIQIFLVGQLAMLGIALMSSDVRETAWAAANAGKSYFGTLYLLLIGICLLFIPVYTAVRLGLERSEQNTDLIFISTLTPKSIIAGKFFASVLFTVLLFSACAPFMAVSYLLRGIDFPTIFLLMGLAFGAMLLCIQLGLFAACVTTNRIFRFVVATLFLGALAGCFFFISEMSKAALRRGLGSAMGTKDFWSFGIMLAMGGGFLLMLLFRMTVSMVSPVSTNRARSVRLMYTLGWGLSGIVCFALSTWRESYVFLFMWAVFHTLMLALGFFVIVGEREHTGARLAREIPRTGVMRFLAFPHFSGIANGLFWGIMVLVGTIVLLFLSGGPEWKHVDEVREVLSQFGGTALFAFAYATTGLLIHRALLTRVVASQFVWMVGLVIGVLCGLVPLLVMVLSLKSTLPITWLILTPFALFKKSTQEACTVVALLWAGVSFLGVLPILLHQFLSFRPPVITKAEYLREKERMMRQQAVNQGQDASSGA